MKTRKTRQDIDGMMGYVKMMYGDYDDVPDLVSDSDSESEWDETPYIPQQYVDDSFPVLSHPLAERAIREELGRFVKTMNWRNKSPVIPIPMQTCLN